MLAHIIAALQGRSERVVQWQRALTALPALGPQYGGQGELAKAQYIETELRRCGVTDIRRVDAPDAAAPCGFRPNIVARVPGKLPRTLWILAHMDVVPAGDPALWTTDPWTLDVRGDVLTGRGVEDNQQGIVSGMLLAAALQEEGVVPDLALGLLLVADEETGNAHGMEYLMREHRDLFAPEDMFVAPDFGAPDGAMLEVAEKHVLWLKFTVTGKQCHGSMPHKGVNAMLAGSDLALRLAALQDRFPARDPLFDPPVSTFTPTRREANVPNVNTVPGTDVLYMDCRLLPSCAVRDVLDAAAEACRAVERERGVSVEMTIAHLLEAAPPTPVESDVVRRLIPAIANVYGVAARPVGVGGSTVACYLRKAGLPAAVWSRLLSNCHEPNEKSLISNNIGDAQVFAHLLFL